MLPIGPAQMETRGAHSTRTRLFRYVAIVQMVLVPVQQVVRIDLLEVCVTPMILSRDVTWSNVAMTVGVI